MRKGISIDSKSDMNIHVILSKEFQWAKIVDSHLEIKEMGNGCFIEHVTTYGDIVLGNHVSISGPGTVLHAVNNQIKIGSFSSIAQNVCINEFNHNMKRPSTYAMNLNFFSKDFTDDVTSKGDVIIGEDVWIGANVSICSGVRIGRGAVIASGSVITKDVEKYSIMGGKDLLIKKRFSQSTINDLEKTEWWKWSDKTIKENKVFFLKEFI